MSNDESRWLKTGAAAAIAGTAVLFIAGWVQAGSPWAPFNTLAAALLSNPGVAKPDLIPSATALGLAICVVGLTVWGSLYWLLFGKMEPPLSLITGALAAAALYGFDYYLLPESYRPGFERYLSWGAIGAKYAAVALALALSTKREG